MVRFKEGRLATPSEERRRYIMLNNQRGNLAGAMIGVLIAGIAIATVMTAISTINDMQYRLNITEDKASFQQYLQNALSVPSKCELTMKGKTVPNTSLNTLQKVSSVNSIGDISLSQATYGSLKVDPKMIGVTLVSQLKPGTYSGILSVGVKPMNGKSLALRPIQIPMVYKFQSGTQVVDSCYPQYSDASYCEDMGGSYATGSCDMSKVIAQSSCASLGGNYASGNCDMKIAQTSCASLNGTFNANTGKCSNIKASSSGGNTGEMTYISQCMSSNRTVSMGAGSPFFTVNVSGTKQGSAITQIRLSSTSGVYSSSDRLKNCNITGSGGSEICCNASTYYPERSKVEFCVSADNYGIHFRTKTYGPPVEAESSPPSSCMGSWVASPS